MSIEKKLSVVIFEQRIINCMFKIDSFILQVTVFRPFFVKLNLPYAIIRSESLYVEVIVFNYMKKAVKVSASDLPI